ncbi:hypothetical protein LOK49_LG14G01912 [Camellia lanceoleosa]|uniref:Uncharacterized protein n=1 Tax=Camellia lanceoleosa TaxID=1840588 RepID=A0ACC0FBC7_9ERIC|nr:hypothetical protein LOK49_LG14G01912 [Camellia lanceoleosa]
MKGQSMGNSKKKVILGKVQIGTSEKRREAQSGGQLLETQKVGFCRAPHPPIPISNPPQPLTLSLFSSFSTLLSSTTSKNSTSNRSSAPPLLI